MAARERGRAAGGRRLGDVELCCLDEGLRTGLLSFLRLRCFVSLRVDTPSSFEML